MMWWFGVALAQGACLVEQETAASFAPRAADPSWGPAGGWDGKRLEGMTSERRAMIKKHKRQFASYPADAQDDVLGGRLRDDLDEVAAWLAWGAPSWTWQGAEKGCRHLLYIGRGDSEVVLSTCDGATQALDRLEAPVSCERLDAVVPRLEKARRAMQGWALEQAAAVLAGLPQPWMTEDELELAFGKPDRKQEKGTRLVFLADDGLHEGPTVILADGRVGSWTFPEEAWLTRTGKRTLRQEERASRQRLQAGQGVVGLLKAAATIGLAVAAEEVEQGAGGGAPKRVVDERSYRNHVRLECNGSVLYEREFTDRASCQAAEASTTIECSGLRMPFGC